MNQKNLSKINTAIASGAVERSAQENIGCIQHCIICYLLFVSTVSGEKNSTGLL